MNHTCALILANTPVVNVCTYIEKRNLITTKRILFDVLVQYLINIMKHNSNQSFVLIITKQSKIAFIWSNSTLILHRSNIWLKLFHQLSNYHLDLDCYYQTLFSVYVVLVRAMNITSIHTSWIRILLILSSLAEDRFLPVSFIFPVKRYIQWSFDCVSIQHIKEKFFEGIRETCDIFLIAVPSMQYFSWKKI